MDSNLSQERPSLTAFVVLVFVLSIPLFVFGGNKLPLPFDLPVSALIVVNPLLAASILTYEQSGWNGVRDLIKRAFDYRKIPKIWYIPILLLNPFIMVLSYAVMRRTGMPLPDPRIPLLLVPVFFILFLISGIGEEVGWMGYAIDPAQHRWGAFKAGIIIGLVWAVWHLIPDIQGRHPANWILWHRLATVANRVLMVWIYNNTRKSVSSSILYHSATNIGWAFFPNFGSHYNPFVTGMITILVAAIVVIGWGPKTLSQYRFARADQVST